MKCSITNRFAWWIEMNFASEVLRWCSTLGIKLDVGKMFDLETVIFLSLLAQIANAYVPSTVEIPPVSENQMQIRGRPQGRNGVRDQRHSSYSYGTTAYHYDNQQGGFASARLSDPNANQQIPITTAAPDQRQECQNPLLRVFFKTCHPPGAAPQSPVQCSPIPGQTSFRCLIKNQAWPNLRVSHCAPGTVFQGGVCVAAPGSSGGTLVVPVAIGSPGGSQLIRSSTSSVYRHCSNGSCRTCIGDQCSTTGLETPVSVDHRFRSNSATEVAAFGDAGRDVKQKCAGQVCKTCIDRICYDRSYPLLRVTAGCPPAVCEENCAGFVYWTDQCPICRCQGFACREPCRVQSDCPMGATCRNQVCVYAELPTNTNFDKVCTFSSQCPSNQFCYNWRCGAKSAPSRHLEDHSCAVDQDCPNGHICADMTCWEGDASRFLGQPCILDHQCPTSYYCTNGACSNVYHHGSFGSFAPSVPTVPSTSDRQCDHDQHCHNGESCFESRCVTFEERRRVEEARNRQQVQHHPWQRPTTIEPVGSELQGTQYERDQRPSPDEEYQRRLAEYNRQKAEQEKQHEERRRQMEEENEQRKRQQEDERRRQDEIENQRRIQEQKLEEERRQQENQRRVHEEEEHRRRQENEEAQQRAAVEAQRREQEELNRKTEENRRREEERRQQERRQQEENRRREEEGRRREQERVDTEDEDSGNYGQVDVEVGEEMPDTSREYDRRLQEYNREIQERQRRLQEMDNEERAQLGARGPSRQEDSEDDFYGRTRQRGRIF